MPEAKPPGSGPGTPATGTFAATKTRPGPAPGHRSRGERAGPERCQRVLLPRRRAAPDPAGPRRAGRCRPRRAQGHPARTPPPQTDRPPGTDLSARSAGRRHAQERAPRPGPYGQSVGHEEDAPRGPGRRAPRARGRVRQAPDPARRRRDPAAPSRRAPPDRRRPLSVPPNRPYAVPDRIPRAAHPRRAAATRPGAPREPGRPAGAARLPRAAPRGVPPRRPPPVIAPAPAPRPTGPGRGSARAAAAARDPSAGPADPVQQDGPPVSAAGRPTGRADRPAAGSTGRLVRSGPSGGNMSKARFADMPTGGPGSTGPPASQLVHQPHWSSPSGAACTECDEGVDTATWPCAIAGTVMLAPSAPMNPAVARSPAVVIRSTSLLIATPKFDSWPCSSKTRRPGFSAQPIPGVVKLPDKKFRRAGMRASSA